MNTTSRLVLFAALPLLLTNACSLTIQGGAPVSDPVAYAPPPPLYVESAPIAPRVVYVESAPVAPRPVMRAPEVAPRTPVAVMAPRRTTAVSIRPERGNATTATSTVAMQARARAIAEAAQRSRQQNRQQFAKYDRR